MFQPLPLPAHLTPAGQPPMGSLGAPLFAPGQAPGFPQGMGPPPPPPPGYPMGPGYPTSTPGLPPGVGRIDDQMVGGVPMADFRQQLFSAPQLARWGGGADVFHDAGRISDGALGDTWGGGGRAGSGYILDGGFGRADWDVNQTLNMGFGPRNPHGLDSSTWQDVGRGALAVLTGGIPGLIGHGVNQWSQAQGGGTGHLRTGLGVAGNLLGIGGLGTLAYDIYTGIRPPGGGSP